MTNSIILTKDLDISKITYDEPRKLENGGKMIYISFKNNPLRIQTPQCYLPFGINVYKNEDSGSETHSMEFSFDGKDTKQTLMDFYEKMRSFDELNIQKGFEYQQSWFRKKYPNKEVIEALYTTMVKFPKDKNGEISTEWPPTFKFKLPFINKEYKFEMYDKANKKIDPSTVQTKGARAVAILKCNGIWLAGGKFGMSWKAEQIQITPPNKIAGFCIRYVKEDMINQEDELSNKMEKLSQNDIKTEDEHIQTDVELSDSEDELEPKSEPKLVPKPDDPKTEPETETEPAPEPEPETEPETEPEIKIKKKVVKKKVVA
jgi:hypothetical protein